MSNENKNSPNAWDGENPITGKRYLQTAADMLDLDVETLGRNGYTELRSRLDEADELCRKCGGRLLSRQAIAAIVVGWKHGGPSHE